MSQKQKILAWMKRGRRITQAQAYVIFGCWRLAARVKELREEGCNIETIREPNAHKGIHGVYQMVQQ